MTINHHWHNQEKTVLHVEFPPKWDWEEFEKAYRESQDEIRAVPHSVGIIWDCQKVAHLPINAMSKVAAFGKTVTPAPNVFGFVVITSNHFLLTLIRVMNSMLRLDKSEQPVSAVATFDGALEYLNKISQRTPTAANRPISD